MSKSRSNAPISRTAAILVAMAILIAGCGIKSAIEPPRASNLAEPAADSAAASRTSQEKSSVQSGQTFNLLPPQTPPEWLKEKKEAKEKRNPESARPGNKSTAPDKPFILDSIL